MHGIERRAKRELFTFTFVDSQRYISLEHYQVENRDFQHRVRDLLPAGWVLRGDSGIWCHCLAPEFSVPNHGFKIHLSATCDSGGDLLDRVVPVLVKHATTFKFLTDARILDFANSQANVRSQCGKFITIYPADVASFKALVEGLDAATADFQGPYILSDKRYGNSKVVFYRYGAFTSQLRLNVFGEQEAYYLDDGGTLRPDKRNPFFSLPEGVEDPYAEPPADPSEDAAPADGAPVLNGRYKAKAVLASSSKGGVYICEDLRTGEEVIVKEARPLVNMTRQNPHDAIAMLRNEWRILQVLADTGFTPRPIGHFKEWEHEFIAMEKVAGAPLSSYRAYESFSIMLQTNYSDQRLRDWCGEFIYLIEQLLAAVSAIHRCGVVLQDLAPQNVLVDSGSARVRLLDFESAYHRDGGDDALLVHVGTIGYSRLDVASDYQPVPEDDYRALGGVLLDLLFPVTLLFVQKSDAKAVFLERLCREKGIPHEFADLILAMGDAGADIPVLLHRARESAARAVAPKQLPPEVDAQGLNAACRSIADYIRGELDNDAAAPTLVPTCYRWYTTNPLSLAYGYCGVALFLVRQSGAVPQRLTDVILEHARDASHDDYAPGLFIGLSGIAWVLEELGHHELAGELMRKAQSSPLVDANADVFFGAAGIGLANLYFHGKRGDAAYLDQAIAMEALLDRHLQATPEGGLSVRNLDGIRYNGYAHGSGGLAMFLLKLHEATGEAAYLHKGERLLAYEIAQAREQDGVLTWPRSSADNIFSPYYRNGTAGTGSVLLRYYRATGNANYLDVARRGAEYLFGKYSAFAGLTDGMAGIGEFLLDMHLFTGEARYREEALRYGDRLKLFMIDRDHGSIFPGDELLRLSADYASGSSGVGLFFLRLANGGPRLLYDFDAAAADRGGRQDRPS